MTERCTQTDVCDELALNAQPERSTPGLGWMPWVRTSDNMMKTAFVLQGRKHSDTTVLRFCPFCGADVSIENQEWRERR